MKNCVTLSGIEGRHKNVHLSTALEITLKFLIFHCLSLYFKPLQTQFLCYYSPEMAYQNIEPVIRILILAGLIIVGIMACTLAVSYYNDARFDRKLKNMEQRNLALQQSTQEGYRLLEYYQSHQYKDKYAKESLGLKNEGEKVLVMSDYLPENQNVLPDTFAIETQQEARFIERVRHIPVYEHWLLYFFYPEKIEEIKKSL